MLFSAGKDGQLWTWVMGEHADDQSIDDILEKETHEKAHVMAEQEVETVRKKHEEALKASLATEELIGLFHLRYEYLSSLFICVSALFYTNKPIPLSYLIRNVKLFRKPDWFGCRGCR